jgi:precorrin-3B synthase
MSAPEIKGWCPGALRPMMSGDGLVVRIRAPLGRLTSQQAGAIAGLSRQYGNGLIDLSARANLQLRGIAPTDHLALIEGLRQFGLVDDSPEIEARRNIMLTPFWQTGDLSHDLAVELALALVKNDAPHLPGKFGFSVDCGDKPVLQSCAADIRFERSQDGSILVRADGSLLGASASTEDAVALAMRLARWFVDSGGAPNGRGRMRPHLAAGSVPPSEFLATHAQTETYAPTPESTSVGTLIALEFGQIDAETLGQLAQLGALRLTPWRMLLIEGNTHVPNLTGLIMDADNPLLRIAACTGAPGCPQAFGQTRNVARSMAQHLPKEGTLHVSGCAKGCAHPTPAKITLTATSATQFDLIRNGTAADQPAEIGLTQSDLAQSLLSEGP